ncbi:GNAT family N-acetyltransferase [Granulicella arctica]|uniref:GNAT family N-acetyltransferase n=1 Tax=Granulicella arctica TaxID=940613 RepID=UPI0021E0DFE3|nr:GNAT family N-acetyltransferase [Granulicella arctica]
MQEIRQYVSADLDQMVALDDECFAEEFRFSHPMMKRFAEARNALTLVLDSEDGGLLGFIIVHIEGGPDGGLGYVVTLDVAAAARRHGVAARLIHEAERRAEVKGALRMMLHVFVQNEPAIRFYEQRGYRMIGLEPEFYGGTGMDAYLYSKSIQGETAP